MRFLAECHTFGCPFSSRQKQPPFLDTAVEKKRLTDGFPSVVSELRSKFIGKFDVQLCDIVGAIEPEHLWDDCHPTPTGHGLLGQKLVDFMVSQPDWAV